MLARSEGTRCGDRGCLIVVKRCGSALGDRDARGAQEVAGRAIAVPRVLTDQPGPVLLDWHLAEALRGECRARPQPPVSASTHRRSQCHPVAAPDGFSGFPSHPRVGR